MQEKRITPITEWASQKVDAAFEIPNVGMVTQESRTRSDGSPITFTTIAATNANIYSYKLLFDQRFTNLGIVTESNGLLIDQKATAEKWGSPAGIVPEKLIEMLDDPISTKYNSVGFPATNTFWQKGGFFVHNGQIVQLPNDQTLKGKFEVLTLTERGWNVQSIDPSSPQDRYSLGEIRIGLSMPMVVSGGLVVPQNEIVARGNLRALADLRNFVDFSDGKNSRPDFNFRFFDLVRKIQPGTGLGAKVLTLDGGGIVVRANFKFQKQMSFRKLSKTPILKIILKF